MDIINPNTMILYLLWRRFSSSQCTLLRTYHSKRKAKNKAICLKVADDMASCKNGVYVVTKITTDKPIKKNGTEAYGGKVILDTFSL